MDDRLMEKLVMEHPELKWYVDFVKINKDFEEQDLEFDEFIQTIPEDKRDLYMYSDSMEIVPNWNGIYCKLFGEKSLENLEYRDWPIRPHSKQDIENIKIPQTEIPYGMKDLFKVDEQGNASRYFNWENIMKLNELVTQIGDKHYSITVYLPEYAGLIIENLDNPTEIMECSIGSMEDSRTGVDLNCPSEIRDNKERMLKLFKLCGDGFDVEQIWELASDRLKNDSDFIQQIESIVGKENFSFIAEFEGIEFEELLERGKKDKEHEISVGTPNIITADSIIQINQQLKDLEKIIQLKRQEAIKTKLKYIKQNGISELSALTDQEREQLIHYLSLHGNPASTLIQHEWNEAYYPEDSGYDFDEYNVYVRLGNKLYSIIANDFIDPKQLEDDYSIGDPENMEDSRGIETTLGNKNAITEELDVDKLFDETRVIDGEDIGDEDEFYKRILEFAHKKVAVREKNEQARDLYGKYEKQMPDKKGPTMDD